MNTSPSPEPTWSEPQAVPPPPPVRLAEPTVARVNQKNPILAGVLSLFPGIGNVYNGLYVRALTFFLLIASLMVLTDREDFFGFVLAFFWIFNVIDAYRQATLINYGFAQDLGTTDLPKRPTAAQGGLAAGILLTLIGLYALLERFLWIDLSWVVDLWPLALMGVGLWLIVGSIRERRKARAGSLEI